MIALRHCETMVTAPDGECCKVCKTAIADRECVMWRCDGKEVFRHTFCQYTRGQKSPGCGTKVKKRERNLRHLMDK